MKPPWILSLLLTAFGIILLSQSKVEAAEYVWGYEIALCGAVGMILAVIFEKLYVGDLERLRSERKLDSEEGKKGREGD